MKNNIKKTLLSLLLSSSAIPLLSTALTSCNNTTPTQQTSIDYSQVNKSTYGWLNDITQTKKDLVYRGFKYNGNLFELNVKAIDIVNFEGDIKTNIIATSNNTFDVQVTFIGQSPLQTAIPQFDLLFFNFNGNPELGQLITDFSARFTANILSLSGGLILNQKICTLDGQTSRVLSGDFVPCWGSFQLEDETIANAFEVEMTFNGQQPKSKLTAAIEHFENTTTFGIRIDADNVNTWENLSINITIKNSLVTNWKYTTQIYLTVSNQINDGFDYKLDTEKQTAIITNFIVSDETINIPETITVDGKSYTVNEIDISDVLRKCINSKVKVIHFPKTIETITHLWDIFLNYPNLEDITVDPENPSFTSKATIDGTLQECHCLLDSARKTLIAGGSKATVIPDGITTIEHAAFANRSNLTSVTLPSSVTELEDSIFFSCPDLQTVDMSAATISKISIACFKNCSKLNIFKFPQNVTQILNEAFCGCTLLPNLTLPDTLVTIGNNAFSSCKTFTTLSIPKNVKKITIPIVYNCDNLTTLSVEDDNVGGYTTKIDGVDYNCIISSDTTIVQAINKTNMDVLNHAVGIGPKAFAGTNITKIVIPTNIINIGQQAFAQCASLESADLSNTLMSWIPTALFKGCSSLTEVKFYTNTTTIYNMAFMDCVKLKNIELPKALVYLKGGAFSNCKYLEKISIPENVSEIGARCFTNCLSLANVQFPANLQTISDDAFFNCQSLQSITIPYFTMEIGPEAFLKCDNLTNVVFEKPWSWGYGNHGKGNPISEKITLDPEASADLLKAGDEIGNFDN